MPVKKRICPHFPGLDYEGVFFPGFFLENASSVVPCIKNLVQGIGIPSGNLQEIRFKDDKRNIYICSNEYIICPRMDILC